MYIVVYTNCIPEFRKKMRDENKSKIAANFHKYLNGVLSENRVLMVTQHSLIHPSKLLGEIPHEIYRWLHGACMRHDAVKPESLTSRAPSCG